MTRSAAALVAVLALGCGKATEPDVDLDASLVTLPADVVLGYGAEAQVEGTALRVAFTGVREDSRCPAGVVCVWQGNAAVDLRVTGGAAPVTIELNTALQPMDEDVAGVRITLLEVQPGPQAGVPTPREAYSVRLRMEPIR